MKKELYAAVIFLIPGFVYCQSDTAEEESIIDKISKIIEVRKSFDSWSETTKPALFSYKKQEEEPAIYTVDGAVLYRGFKYGEWGIFPAVQFLYTSGGKKRREYLEGSLFGLILLYDNEEGKGSLEPSVSFSKDFFSEEKTLKGRLVFNPSYERFFIPIRNVTNYKFKYNGKDNHWVFGLNPIVGFGYEYDFEENSDDDVKLFYNIAHLSMSLKRYYLEVTAYGEYDKQFEDERKSYYKYGGILSVYLDEKERSSINVKIEKERRKSNHDTEISLGFGLRL